MTREEFAKINTLSDLFEIALEDMKALNRDEYKPDFGVFFSSNDVDDVCHVCAAGAVMANTLGDGLVASEHGLPETYGNKIFDRLVAIDEMRKGKFLEAWRTITERYWDTPKYVEEMLTKVSEKIPRIQSSMFLSWGEADAFIENGERVVDELRAVGL